MKKALLLGALLLPVICLTVKWTLIPAQVSLHFSRHGADVLGPKWLLGLLALLPLLLYAVLPKLRPANPREPFYQQVSVGLPFLFSLALSAWFISLPAAS